MRFLTWLPLAVLGVLPLDRLPVAEICGFRWLSGLPCPLCGLTHGLAFLMHAQLVQAVQWHLLAPIAALLLGAYPLIGGSNWWQFGRTRTLASLAILFGIYGVWRWCAILVWKA